MTDPMSTEQIHSAIRQSIAAATAVLHDHEAAAVEAARLLQPVEQGMSPAAYRQQLLGTYSACLYLAAGMIKLIGDVTALEPEEILQRLALSFEQRWAAS